MDDEIIAGAVVEPSVIRTRIFQEDMGGVTYLGLELPADFFASLDVKNGDEFVWERVDNNTYNIAINRK